MITILRRYIQVVLALLPYGIAFLRDYRRFLLVGRGRDLPRARHEKRAAALTETFLDLGPAFIKAGQVLSTRPDLVPGVYAEAFGTLQDEVPESEGDDPATVVAAELGEVVDVDALEPVAGGSLAYVYRAPWTGPTGQEVASPGEQVALKVRRPGVRGQIERDLRIIRGLVRLTSPLAPERHRFSLRNIADDFEDIILDELDFEREARMMAEIRENLADDDRICIPAVATAETTERVLVMEYVEGVKITDQEAVRDRGVEPEVLASVIAEVYFRMGLRDGIFHADPHPGNLAVTDDGQLLIYDFGMSEELSPAVRRHIVDLYRALVFRDVDRLIDALVSLDVLDPDVNRREVGRVLELVFVTLSGEQQITWKRIIEELTAGLREFPFRIPPNVMLLVRVGTVGEGVCRSLDPEFDFIDAAREYLTTQDEIATTIRDALGDTTNDLRMSIPALARMPRRLDQVLGQLERGELVVQGPATESSADPDSRVGVAIIASGLVVAAAIVYTFDGGVTIAGGLALGSVVFFAWYVLGG